MTERIERNSGRRSAVRVFVGDRPRPVALLTIGSILSGLTESGVLAILAEVAAALANGSARVHANIGPLRANATIGTLLGIATGLALLRLALQAVTSIVPARLVSDLEARLRSEVYAAFTHASWDVQSRDREGQLQEILTNQIARASTGALQATTLLVSLTTFLVLVASALVLNVFAALLTSAAAVGMFAILRPLSSLGSRQGSATSRSSIGYASGVNETVRLAEETHVFGVGAAQREHSDALIAAVRKPQFRALLLARLVPGVYQSLIYLLMVAALIVLYVTGGHVASLAAAILLLLRAGLYGQLAQGAYQVMRQELPYIERVRQAQRRYALSVPPYGARPLDTVQVLAFEDVSFSYVPDRPVLSGINFEVASGEAIGIVGPSGAGKSTFVQLLLRVRSPEGGRYLVNGVPAGDFANSDWHRLFAYVPQEPQLLHATVAENIRFFRDLDADAVKRAAQLAGIHNDIMGWSDGYDTVVGPRADAVSGGQQQRICLARALAAEPEVLVLDEPTSALDPHSERLIQDSLETLKGKLTLFVVAHRMSTLQMCERVMVIVDGRLEAFDAVDRLRLNSSYYRSASALAAGGSWTPS